MISAFAAVSALASGLGTYNIARFVAVRAIKKRRQVKEFKNLVGDVKAAVKYAKTVRDAVSDGISPEEAAKAKAIAKAVTDALNGKAEAPKTLGQ